MSRDKTVTLKILYKRLNKWQDRAVNGHWFYSLEYRDKRWRKALNDYEKFLGLTNKIMNEKLIQSKIQELRIALEQELPDTVVSFEIKFTGTGNNQRTEHKQPSQLKSQGISMRNIKGEFI